MAKRTKKLNRPSLKLEALEQRQLLAGIIGGGTELTPGGADTATVQHYITHPNGNHYDQVLMTGSAVTVTNDTNTITRVSFLDQQGDIVQAEFSGAGTLTISLDQFVANVDPVNYNQTGVKYAQGLATFTIEGSNSSTNLSVFSVGSLTAVNSALFDSTHTGGDHTADVARIAIVADTGNPNGSAFGSILAGNAIFAGDTGPIGISAAGVQIQGRVIISDIKASGSATSTLIFGTNSQFGDVILAGGGLVNPNGKAINNTGSYEFGLDFRAGTKSDNTVDAKESTLNQLSFTGKNPASLINRTFALTSGVDIANGGDGNDTFNAGAADVSAFDTLTGGNGTDVLNVNNPSGVLTLNTTTATTISGIETVNIQNGLGAAVADLSAMTGLQSVWLNNIAATANTVNTKGNATSVSVTGGTTVNVSDLATTDTLSSVTVTNSTGKMTLSSDVLATLNLNATGGEVAITAAAGTRALTINAKGVTGGIVGDGTATSLSIVGTDSASTFGAVTVGAATSVTLNAGKDLTLGGLSAGAATSLTITGSGKVTTGTLTAAKLTSVDAGGASGNVTITGQLALGAAYTGSSAKDTIEVGATTKAVATGTGDDSVTLGAAAPGTGGSLAGGDGTDTLTMAGADVATAGGGTAFGAAVSGFEKLVVTAAFGGTADVTKLTNINDITFSGDVGGGSLTKVVNNSNITINAANSGTLTLGLTDTAADSLNLNLGGGDNAGVNYGTIAAAKVETLNITTDSTNKAPDGTALVVSVTDDKAATINVSGDAGLTLTSDSLAITSITTTGITKGGLTFTSGLLGQAATITTGAGNDTLTVSAATAKAVTINAGDGDNKIIANNNLDNSITTGKGDADITVAGGKNTIVMGESTTQNKVSVTGNGANNITGGVGVDKVTVTGNGNNTISVGDGANVVDTSAGTGNNTVTAGSGADTITTGSGNDTINGGTGNDTISSGAGLDIITGGGGNDTFIITTAGTSSTKYATITDLSVGDKIQFATNSGTEAFGNGGAKIAMADTTPFQTYLDAAAAGDGNTANGIINWFQYQGNTYVVYDVSAGATFVDGVDTVVKLTGNVDLSTGPSTVTAGTGGAPVLTIV